MTRLNSPSLRSLRRHNQIAGKERRLAALAELLGAVIEPSMPERIDLPGEGERDAQPIQTDCLLLRAEEAASLLGIGRTKVFELVRSGDIPVIRIGRLMRIPRDALMTWIDCKTTGKVEGDRARKEHLKSA